MVPIQARPKKIDWKVLQTRENEAIRVSNPDLAVPSGLSVIEDFVSDAECLDILSEHDKGPLVWEGFEQRRRVRRWTLNNADIPDSVIALVERFKMKTGYVPDQISMEEYPASQLQKHFNDLHGDVTTFESATICPKENCSCFVAILPIAASVVEKVNRPKERRQDCWLRYSESNHNAGIILERRSMYIKTADFLWEWRRRISSAIDDGVEKFSLNEIFENRFVLLKFSMLPRPVIKDTDSQFGYIAKPEDLLPRLEEMPALEELLTIVVTTSPIKSNPSTELFERIFHTFFLGGEDFALKCRKIIVCDGYREQTDSVSKRHSNSKQAMRNGIVNTEQLKNYEHFKTNLRSLCESAPHDSPFHTANIEELDERLGYGFALRHALRNCVDTPYVIVIQHDRAFMRTCPIYETVKTMWRYRNIKYVGMTMRSNLLYQDIFRAKFGKSYMAEMAACTLRPPELLLDSDRFGPDSQSTKSMNYGGNEKMKKNIEAYAETYFNSHQNLDHIAWLNERSLPPGKTQLSLTPTFFWYDNTHICETAHYRDFVFDPEYKMVVRGGFVEDKLSPVIKKTVERFGLTEGHSRFGCFLLDDHSGMFFTGHWDGGTYLTKAEKDSFSSKPR